MRWSPALQKSFNSQDVNPELVLRLKHCNISDIFKDPLAEYLARIGASVGEILDPTVQRAIHESDNSVTGDRDKRSLVFTAANDDFDFQNIW